MTRLFFEQMAVVYLVEDVRGKEKIRRVWGPNFPMHGCSQLFF
jgi:hypothetical protein